MQNGIIEHLRGAMIVSCQSEGDDPFNTDPTCMALFAKAAEMGGARAIRTEGIAKLKAIKTVTKLPVIGLIKSTFPDGTVRITGSTSEVEELLDVGCDIVAIDGTFRERGGLSGPDFIAQVKDKYHCPVLADIAMLDEALACERCGADYVSTTLSGYTPETFSTNTEPDYELLSSLVSVLKIPVFAEGRYNTPAQAQRAMELGAFAVITGTAITRPRVITSWFVNAVNIGMNKQAK